MLSKKEKEFQESYIFHLIANNPLKKIFPVTYKSNHAIPLNIWFSICLRMGLKVILCDYVHSKGNNKTEIKKMIKLI